MELIDELDGEKTAETHDTPSRRGRPPGSVALTDETQRTIVTFIRAGTFITSAAEAAGIGRSTLFEWMARGEGRHKTRPMTPKLRRFAREVNRAHAEARASAEARVHDKKPLHWLRYDAGSDGDAVDDQKRTDSPSLLDVWIQELLGPSGDIDRPQ